VCRDEVAALQAATDTLHLAVPQLPAPRKLKQRVMSSVHEEPRAPIGRARRRRLRFAPARPALALGITLIVAAGVGLGIGLSAGSSGGTRLVHATVTTPSGSAVVRLVSGHGELIVRGLPAPPRGKIYEVWLERAGGMPSPTSALFSVTSAGSGSVDVPGDLHGVEELLVTPEPLGGSSVPTHAPVILARLS
jgi:hypothetical protein